MPPTIRTIVDTAGNITTTPASTAGHMHQEIGKAVSATAVPAVSPFSASAGPAPSSTRETAPPALASVTFAPGALSVISPPPGVYFVALSSRFWNTCWIFTASIDSIGIAPVSSTRMWAGGASRSMVFCVFIAVFFIK